MKFRHKCQCYGFLLLFCFVFIRERESFVVSELLDQMHVAEGAGDQRHGQTFVPHVDKGERLGNFQCSICPLSMMPIATPLQEGNERALGPGELSWPLSQACVGRSLPAVPQMPLALTGSKPLKKQHLVFYFTPFSGRSKDVYRPKLDRLYDSPSKGRDCVLHLYSLKNKKYRKTE